ncbi:MAG: ABC transporter ATP-binding protein [Armatimonadetes bacterium]|nr:ABC transporter ATP-binding protein [Armatimonadota bacterium]
MKSFRRLGRFLAPYWLAALAAPLLMALEVAMDLAQPRLLQQIVDVGVARGDLALVSRTGLFMLLAASLGAVGGIGCTVFATIAALGLGTDLRGALFRRVQELSFDDLARLETGSLITRLTNDVEQVQHAAAMLLRILVRAPLLVVGSLIMAVVTCPQLAPLLLGIAPVLVLTFVVIMRNAQVLFNTVQACLDRLNVIVQENLAGVRVIKAFVRAQHELGRFGTANLALRDAMVRASSTVAGLRPIMLLVVNLGVVGVLWWGGWLLARGEVQVGQILAFMSYLTEMLFSLMMVGMLLIQLARAEASAQRLLEVLQTQPEVRDRPGATAPEPRGEVVFEAVEFHHSGSSRPVLSEVSCRVAPGTTAAVIGATGSGKSTLLQLIPRLYEVGAGRVVVDGTDVRDWPQDALRQRVVLALQEALLFSGTIRDNIRYGQPDASEAAVEEAARLAQAHEFISALPDGYDTLLGQRGVNLSGGQKQRLAIARALVGKPTVLLLDDCTSAVDATTEAAIVKALDSWSHRCTRIVVAQRLGSVMGADQILVLEDGRIAAAGTHRELLASSPLYQEIARSQRVEQEGADG